MTAQKKLKTMVRARIQKTGESYMVARRHVLDGSGPEAYRLRGGLHPETSSLSNALANRGMVDPLTEAPLSEALILGVGGGVGAGYILWEFSEGDRRVVTTGFRNQWQYPERWYQKTSERLGVPVDTHRTSGAGRARQDLERALADGQPSIALISAADLPYWHLPAEESGWWGYPITLYGVDDDGVMVDDRNTGPLRLTHEELSAARGRIPSYKNLLAVPDAAATELDEETLVRAVEVGLADQVEHLSQRSDSFSLPAIRKWSRMLTDTKNAKAWPNVFANGRGLLGAIVSSHEAVSDVGILGGNLRRLYASFLAEAGRVTERPLGSAADAYAKAAEAWKDFSEVCITPSVAAIVSADLERREAVAAGDPSSDAAAIAAARSAALMKEDDVDLDAAGRTQLFSAMADALADVYEAEVAAIAELSGVMD